MKKNTEQHPVVKWDWARVEAAVRSVIDTLRDHKPSSIIGVLVIPYGGYIPGVLISKRLGFHGRLKPINDTSVIREGRYIIVDEIADSGMTMKTVGDRFPNAVYVSLVATVKAKSLLSNRQFFTGETISRTWVQFPWELEDEEK